MAGGTFLMFAPVCLSIQPVVLSKKGTGDLFFLSPKTTTTLNEPQLLNITKKPQ